MSEFNLADIFGAGPWACHCGVMIDWPGACDKCAARWQREQEVSEAQAALDTIPDHFLWSRFDAPEFALRVDRISSNLARTAFHLMVKEQPEKDSLVLLGEAGSGKTSIAVAILQQLVSKLPQIGIGARFVAALDLAHARKDSAFGCRPAILEMAGRASVLFVDDIGAEPLSLASEVAEVIQARHNSSKPTVYTSWQTEQQIKQRYGEGVSRRIFERGTVVKVEPYAEPAQSRDGGAVVRLAIK